ncbi:MAG TPA: hypothetical protein VGF94_29685 [Kofleriaceae bacterium]|jgi:hypothetical protein
MLRALLVVPLWLAVGCYVDDGAATGDPAYYGGAPQMDVVAPGVQVVAVDADYPVFYSDGLYYRYYGGGWYSSRWHDRGWGAAYNVPVGVRGIDRPYAYAHYHARGGYGGGYGRGGYGRGGGGPAYRGNARGNAGWGGRGEVRAAPGRAAPAYHAAPVRAAPARHR